MVKKIISHLNPRHVDDFFAIALTKNLYPHTNIEFVSPQGNFQNIVNDPESILIDVGGEFNPDKNNFDHHQDNALPCSLLMILGYFYGKDYSDHPVVRLIDEVDKTGVIATSQKYGYQFAKNLDDYRKPIILTDISKHYKEITDTFFATLEKTTDYNEFFKILYETLDSKGVLEESKEILRKEEEEFQRKLSQIDTYEIKGMKVVFSRETLAPNHYRVFQQTNADIIVEPNSMNPAQTSLIRNSKSPLVDKIDLSKIFDVYPKVFIHNTGFIAVVNETIDTFDISQVANVLAHKRSFPSRKNSFR